MSTHQNLLGYYVGICRNKTAGGSANLVLLLHGLSGSRVHGEIGLYGDLSGGGPFHGILNDQSLSFSTCEPTIQLLIEWKAQFRGERLHGGYEVFCDHPEVAAESCQHQYGLWNCERVRLLGESDPSRVNLVSVFHEGQCYGPFTMDAFAHDVEGGRWPPTAVVALEDLTVFLSLTELWAFLESQRTPLPQQPSFGEEVARETGKKIISTVLASIVLAAFGFGSD